MLKEKSSKKPINDIIKSLYPFFVWQLITVIVSFAAMYIVIIVAGDAKAGLEYVSKNVLMLALVSYIVTLPFFVVIGYYRILNAKKDGTITLYKSDNYAKYLFIIPLAVFGMYAGNILVSLIEMMLPSALQHSYDDVAGMIYGSNYVIQIIAAGIIGPIIEELCFRFFMYGSLKKVFGFRPACIITSIVFGLTHGNLAQFMYAFLLSLIFIFVYEKYKSIAAPIIAHISANTVGIVLSNVINKGDITANQVASASNTTQIFAMLFVLGFSLMVMGIMIFVINKFVHPKKIWYSIYH